MYVEMEKKQPFDYIKELRHNWNKISGVDASAEEVLCMDVAATQEMFCIALEIEALWDSTSENFEKMKEGYKKLRTKLQ